MVYELPKFGKLLGSDGCLEFRVLLRVAGKESHAGSLQAVSVKAGAVIALLHDQLVLFQVLAHDKPGSG